MSGRQNSSVTAFDGCGWRQRRREPAWPGPVHPHTVVIRCTTEEAQGKPQRLYSQAAIPPITAAIDEATAMAALDGAHSVPCIRLILDDPEAREWLASVLDNASKPYALVLDAPLEDAVQLLATMDLDKLELCRSLAYRCGHMGAPTAAHHLASALAWSRTSRSLQLLVHGKSHARAERGPPSVDECCACAYCAVHIFTEVTIYNPDGVNLDAEAPCGLVHARGPTGRVDEEVFVP